MPWGTDSLDDNGEIVDDYTYQARFIPSISQLSLIICAFTSHPLLTTRTPARMVKVRKKKTKKTNIEMCKMVISCRPNAYNLHRCVFIQQICPYILRVGHRNSHGRNLDLNHDVR